MGNLVGIVLSIILVISFLSPIYYVSNIIDNSYHNRWNDYKIKEIEYDGEKYYVAYVYCGRFYFKKIYKRFNSYVSYPIKTIDTGDCKVFYSKDDLVKVLAHKYEEDIKKTRLNKLA